MFSYIPFKNEFKPKLNNLQFQAKKKYINLISKLLVFSINSVNHFARHIIVLQGKNPDYVVPEPITEKILTRAISDVRPSFNFSSSSRGWNQSYFKNPEKYHPILVGRIKTDKDGVLKVSQESDYMTSALKLAEAVEVTTKMENYEASNALDLIEASLGVSLPQTDSSLEDVNIVSGSRSVSKKKISVKKVSPKKKNVRVKRVKKGVFHRVED